MTPRVRRVLAVVTLVLALALVGVLALRAFGVPIALGPGSNPTPVPSVSPSADPSTSASPTLEEVLAGIEADVADFRDLPPADIGPAEFISREELEQRLTDAFAEDYPADEIAADNVLYRALGLLAADQDIGQLQVQLLSSQVVGYYDDQTQTMVLVADAGATPEVEVVYAHEYTHALQDAAFGIDSLNLDDRADDDGTFARVGLLEGDATTAMVLWAYQNLSAQEILEISQTPLPDTSGVPAWMVRRLEFPYLAGTDFSAQLFARGGFAAVDEAWADPPRSTEHVIHFQKYVDDEAVLEAQPLNISLTAGLEVARETTFGESMTAIWLAALGVAQDDAAQAAAGWGGDAITAFASMTTDDVGVVLVTSWDSPLDATEFSEAYDDALGRLEIPGVLVQLSDTETAVIQATTDQLVETLTAFLSVLP
jgi:hypothetical protein